MKELAVRIEAHLLQVDLSPSTKTILQEVLECFGKVAKKSSKFDLSKVPLPGNLNNDKWEEWVENRKQCSKQITQVAAKKQLEFLSQYSIVIQGLIIDQSIMNGYQGLFHPRGINNGQLGPNHASNPRPDTSAAGRVRAEIERARAARAATGNHGMAMADDDQHVRPQVGEQLRSDSGPGKGMGELLEGSFRRTD